MIFHIIVTSYTPPKKPTARRATGRSRKMEELMNATHQYDRIAAYMRGRFVSLEPITYGVITLDPSDYRDETPRASVHDVIAAEQTGVLPVRGR